jgi:hypothetical protein
MSNDSPVKGFRKLGGAQQPPQPPNSSDPWQNASQPPAPADPFSAPPTYPAAPISWPSDPSTPDPWQAAAPPPPPGISNVPNPPPPPPWQALPQQPAQPYYTPPSPAATPYQQGNYGYQPQFGPNPNTAYLAELLGGLFGFFGIGYMYAGKTGEGVIRLIVGIVCNIIVGISAALTVGICAFIALPVYIVVAVVSAGAIKNSLLRQYQNP